MFNAFRRLGAALALAALPFAAMAQTAPATQTQDADPALWAVKDEDTTIYLFGTVHVLKPGLSWFDEAVRTAFDSSGEVVLEMVAPEGAEMQALVMKTAVNASGKPLTERLPEDQRAAYSAAMTGIGLPPAAFDQFDPWFAAMTLALVPVMKLGYDPNSGAEKVISAAAKAAGKPVTGLETPEQQIGFLDGLSEEAQIAFLAETVKETEKLGETLDTMVASWAKGDAEALAVAMNDSLRATPEISKALLADRNIRWAEWIRQRLDQPGTVFMAVGAGHLAGADSVQAQLAKHEVKAERITY